ncbi:hypothetical protein EDC04DRAFT_3142407 [Pisolithus marmoratus]|nr:hypothetical protein EDC04DRAFT_3142407 [Pisolithus marmoratus]
MSSITGSETTINAFVDQIRPCLGFILAGTACSACLFTLLIILLGFSTKESRRHLVFRLNVFAICVALTLGIFTCLTSGKAIVDPFNQVSKSVYMTGIVFAVYPPLLYDSILSSRLFALYPVASTPSLTLVKVFAFPFCIKCARVVAVTLWLKGYIKTGITTLTLVQPENPGAIWYRNPNSTTEWTMQIMDNLYSVSFFLYNLHIRTSSVRRAGGISERIRQIFYISVANFVFPLLFNIALIVLVTADRSAYAGTLLVLINNFVTVIGVLCATLWFSGSEWVRGHKESLSDDMFSPNPNSGRANGVGKRSENKITVIGGRSVTLDRADFARRGSDKFQAASSISDEV